MSILKNGRQALDDWNYIFKAELKKVFQDKGVLIFFILVPLAYPLLYAFIYNNEVIREVPTAVVDYDNTALSRQYIRNVDATPDVHIVAHCTSMAEAEQLIKNREVYGIVRIPSDFTRNINTMQQAHVGVYADMSGLLYYKALLLANTNVSLAMNADIKVQRKPSTTVEQDKVTQMPIRYEQVDLYNPQTGFAAFLIPAVLILVLQQTLVLGVGLSAGTDNESNRYRELQPINSHFNGMLRIVFGKGFAYLLVYLWNIAFVLEVVPRIFCLPQIGNPLDLWLIAIPFLLAIIFMAMTVTFLIRQRETGFMLIVFASVPLLFLSGVSWPGVSIPTFWKYVSYLFPSTFGVNAYIKINSLGAEMGDVKPEWHALWIQTFFYFTTTCIIYTLNIRRSRRRFIEMYRERKERKRK
ncbi:ABC transporter permease [Alloprevotella rava]|uniref:ABC-2 type transport system permease protein n=1 Tax=Alloprevotella rava TaxID=671218 RepID=A0A7W5XX53_9BACT|nr:ABC transporter permease [Alloprevotella rava]MBB3701963.1 ABC-2 type transport system permease protein [Alloprevotella rava]